MYNIFRDISGKSRLLSFPARDTLRVYQTNNSEMRSIIMKSTKIRIIAMAIIMAMGAAALSGCSGLGSKSESKSVSGTIQSEAASDEKENEDKTDAQGSETDTEPSEKVDEGTYEHNPYYDVVETASYKDSIGYTHLIHKVLAKQDISVDATVIAYGKDDKILGKSNDSVALTKDKYNYFSYTFEKDIKDARLDVTMNTSDDKFTAGERNGVEMVKYQIDGHSLYITFKQVVDELGSFAKFKLLYYKGDKIVGTEDGYFNISAENLNGNGSTDVAELWIHEGEFDKVEYVFEP